MPKFHVHLYREMRAYYPDITADTPEQAARIADSKSTTEAKYVDDCDGTTLSALVDHDGDDEYFHSQIIDLNRPKSLARAATPLPALVQIDFLEGSFVIDVVGSDDQ